MLHMFNVIKDAFIKVLMVYFKLELSWNIRSIAPYDRDLKLNSGFQAKPWGQIILLLGYSSSTLAFLKVGPRSLQRGVQGDREKWQI